MVRPFSSRKPRFKTVPPIVLFGLVIFLTAFFLPSVAGDPHPLLGFQCAYITLMEITSPFKDSKDAGGPLHNLAIFACGMMSFFTLAEFTLRLLDGPSRFARVLTAIALLICLPSNVYILISMKTRPIYGFYIWVLGIVLILFPEILAVVRRSRT